MTEQQLQLMSAFVECLSAFSSALEFAMLEPRATSSAHAKDVKESAALLAYKLGEVTGDALKKKRSQL